MTVPKGQRGEGNIGCIFWAVVFAVEGDQVHGVGEFGLETPGRAPAEVVGDQSFWADSPAMARPFTGFANMYLENQDYSRQAWGHVLELLERLVAAFG